MYKIMKTEAGIRPPTQPKLIPLTTAELAELKDELYGMVSAYLQLESEKQAAAQDWNELMGGLWEKIKLQRAKIEGGQS